MEENKKENNEQNDLIELGADLSKTSKGNIYTLTIIGQVEGHQVLPETAKTTKYEQDNNSNLRCSSCIVMHTDRGTEAASP